MQCINNIHALHQMALPYYFKMHLEGYFMVILDQAGEKPKG